ncbi:MAG: hypothetical protein ACYSUA_19560 [Planctomycetota bacterium]|jgi:hypothetical protein
MLEDRGVVHDYGGPGVLGLDQRERSLRHIRMLVQDRNQVTVAHDLNAFERLGRGRIGLVEPGAVDRRSQNPRVEHAGQPDVAGVQGLAGDLVHGVHAPRVPPAEATLGLALERCRLVEPALDPLAVGKLGVGDAVVRVASLKDDAVLDDQPIPRRGQVLRRQLEQNRPRLRAGAAQGRAEVLGAE